MAASSVPYSPCPDGRTVAASWGAPRQESGTDCWRPADGEDGLYAEGRGGGERAWLGKDVFVGVVGSGCLAALSLPAMIGAWCWPALLAAALGPAFQQVDGICSRRLAHTLTFAVDLAAFCSLLTFVAVKTPGKRGALPCLPRWAPFFGMALASMLIMADLLRHVLLDAGLLGGVLSMYTASGSLSMAGQAGMCCTWAGNALMAVSLLGYMWPARSGGRMQNMRVAPC